MYYRHCARHGPRFGTRVASVHRTRKVSQRASRPAQWTGSRKWALFWRWIRSVGQVRVPGELYSGTGHLPACVVNHTWDWWQGH